MIFHMFILHQCMQNVEVANNCRIKEISEKIINHMLSLKRSSFRFWSIFGRIVTHVTCVIWYSIKCVGQHKDITFWDQTHDWKRKYIEVSSMKMNYFHSNKLCRNIVQLINSWILAIKISINTFNINISWSFFLLRKHLFHLLFFLLSLSNLAVNRMFFIQLWKSVG